MMRRMIVASLMLLPHAALAQDKASLEHQQKIDAANRQIDALKAAVIGLQSTVAQLQGQVQALGKPNGAAKEPPKEPTSVPAAK